MIEQQLTVDEVPVIVDKCINFVSTHGESCVAVMRVIVFIGHLKNT